MEGQAPVNLAAEWWWGSQVYEVACKVCGAQIGEKCTEASSDLLPRKERTERHEGGCHIARAAAAEIAYFKKLKAQ